MDQQPKTNVGALEQFLASAIFPRMGLWLWLSIGLCALIWFLAPHMVKVGVYKLALITVAAFIGYHISRALESSGWRPHELIKQAEEARKWGDQFSKGIPPDVVEEYLKSDADVMRYYPSERAWQLDQLAAAAYQRRALVVSACMIAAALGS